MTDSDPDFIDRYFLGETVVISLQDGVLQVTNFGHSDVILIDYDAPTSSPDKEYRVDQQGKRYRLIEMAEVEQELPIAVRAVK